MVMGNILPYLLAYVIPILTWWGISSSGGWTYSGFIFAFFIHPLFDVLFGKDTKSKEENLTSKLIYDLLIWAYLPFQMLIIHHVFIHSLDEGLSLFEVTGTILSLGTMTGATGITVAHELIHRKKPIERGLGISLLLMVNYAHFRIEHVFGHHKHVGTLRDPATARRGENLYRFWVRSIVGGWMSAWMTEKKRVEKKGFIFNRVFLYLLAQILISLFVYFFYGKISSIVFILQSFLAIITLEMINFIEHYGLERKEISPGQYEPVTAHHSWDSTQRMTNWFLFNLGKHAHHHFAPNVSYEELETKNHHKELKYGYSTHLVLAFFGIYPTLDERNDNNFN
jgi:alkane 1-monooxygenase